MGSSSFLDIAQSAVNAVEADARRAEYRNNPVLWAEEIAGLHLWSLQGEIAQSVADNKDVAVKAGHGVGKSLLAAVLICWWVDTRYPLCFVASTAPSASQIGAIVWREVRMLYGRIKKRYEAGVIDHQLPGTINADIKNPEWKGDHGILIGFGRKPPDQKTDDAFQGIHAQDGVLAIGDEAVGLTEEMIDALGNITSTSTSRRLLICNPTNPASYVGRLFKTKPSNWTFHTISVFQSPNFTGEDVPPEAKAALTDESYVNSKREEYGEGTPRWQSRVLGEFAWDMGYTLIRPEDIDKGISTEIDPANAPLVLGVDVSRSKAGDKNSVYSYRGGVLRYVDSWNDANAVNTVDRIHQLAMEHLASEVRIDASGLGGPMANYLVEKAQGNYPVIEILGGNASPDKNRWYNFRSWSWWSLQDRLSRGLIDLDPLDVDLHDQLMSVEIKKRLSGIDNLLLLSKEEMKKSGISSPDLADSAVYASIDFGDWASDPTVGLKPGEKVVFDPMDVLGIDYVWGVAGTPM